MKEFDKLKELVSNAQPDVDKVDAGQKAAGTRVRKAMQAIKEQAQVIRGAVLGKSAASVAADVGKQVGGPGSGTDDED